ncbi:Universal stress protein [Nonomuraea coxensis DSM 45129]|uniref:Universal stress protein n=1 Tax=Nonomuraea coxensis DSM 45129 TaxID=1122611 RepID=A0ABX8U2K3_9ACTN|nr:Universal stress protein [Nonomuraea coxensis DSM 45129]
MMRGPVVAGTDGSPSSAMAVEWAATDARRRGLPLRIVHVCEQWTLGVDTSKYCEGALEAAADRARALSADVQVSTAMLGGNVIDALLAESVSAESLVLGSRGVGGFAGMMLGSVGLAVAGHAAGPVVIVRGSAGTEHGVVVAGDDGSAGAGEAVAYAIDQARAQEARLRVIFAWRVPVVGSSWPVQGPQLAAFFEEDARAARARADRWREANPDVVIIDEQLRDHPVAALTKAAATADLVVVGSRGLGGFSSAVLGSISHGVLHHARCPVAVVRPHQGAAQEGP